MFVRKGAGNSSQIVERPSYVTVDKNIEVIQPVFSVKVVEETVFKPEYIEIVQKHEVVRPVYEEIEKVNPVARPVYKLVDVIHSVDRPVFEVTGKKTSAVIVVSIVLLQVADLVLSNWEVIARWLSSGSM